MIEHCHFYRVPMFKRFKLTSGSPAGPFVRVGKLRYQKSDGTTATVARLGLRVIRVPDSYITP